MSIQEIIEIILAIVGAVSVIVKITPTLRDDSIWLPIVKFLSVFIALNPTVDHSKIREEGVDLTDHTEDPNQPV